MTPTQIATLKNKAIRYGHVNVYDFKARGLGDDIGPLNEALDFIHHHDVGGTLFFPNSQPKQTFYKISDTFVIGGRPITATDALKYSALPGYGAPSFNIDQYIGGGAMLPVSLKFGSRAYLQGTFPKTDELKPILNYSCSAYTHRGNDTQNTKIEGLKIIGRTGLDYIKDGFGGKQVGLLMTGGNDIDFTNCAFYSLEEGFIHNASYHNDMRLMRFNNCDRGFFTLGGHALNGTTFKADRCKKAFEIKSDAGFNGMHTQQCVESLHVGGGFNSFSNLYMETHDSGAHVQVGYNDESEPVDGTTITSMNLAGPQNGKGIVMNATALGLMVIGSNVVSTRIETTNAQNIIEFKNCGVDREYTTNYIEQKGKIYFT